MRRRRYIGFRRIVVVDVQFADAAGNQQPGDLLTHRACTDEPYPATRKVPGAVAEGVQRAGQPPSAAAVPDQLADGETGAMRCGSDAGHGLRTVQGGQQFAVTGPGEDQRRAGIDVRPETPRRRAG